VRNLIAKLRLRIFTAIGKFLRILPLPLVEFLLDILQVCPARRRHVQIDRRHQRIQPLRARAKHPALDIRLKLTCRIQISHSLSRLLNSVW
jgi:hypothetical protein